jgi:hypothetical protein
MRTTSQVEKKVKTIAWKLVEACMRDDKTDIANCLTMLITLWWVLGRKTPRRMDELLVNIEFDEGC